MKTHAIITYSFDELSDDAKQKAIEHYRNTCSEIFWADELLESFCAVFKAANVTLKDYELGLYNSNIRIDLNDTIGDLTGARAFAWLENNLFYKLRITRADYLKNRKAYLSYGRDYRIGCVKPGPLTGYCADESFLNHLTDAIKSGNTLKDAFLQLADVYQSLLNQENDFQNSEEYISEHMQANEYEFLENGTQY